MGCCVLDKPTQPNDANPPAAKAKESPQKTEKDGERGGVVGPDDERIEYSDGCSAFLAWFGLC